MTLPQPINNRGAGKSGDQTASLQPKEVWAICAMQELAETILDKPLYPRALLKTSGDALMGDQK